jgi:hypothetical protein
MNGNGLVRHETPAPALDEMLRAGPRLSAEELRAQELVHAFGAAACAMVDTIKHTEKASPAARLQALARIADVSAFHHHRLKLEIDTAKEGYIS